METIEQLNADLATFTSLASCPWAEVADLMDALEALINGQKED